MPASTELFPSVLYHIFTCYVPLGRDREIDYYYINMDTSVRTKLKLEYQAEFDKYKEADNIPIFLNDKFVTGTMRSI